LVEDAGKYLGQLDAYSTLIPDIDFFIHMHVQKEALLSNLIEGTQTELEDALLEEEEISPDKRNNWHEIRNYVLAMNFAVSKLEEFPVSMRLLNDTHKILLSGVRGQQKQPGEIRSMQNWLGSNNITDARYIPPAPLYLPELLSDMESFWHNKKISLPAVIKTAITHYQFETIHPYNDGNGRIGRLLITLQLIDNNLLSYPVLYISDYFEENRNKYFSSFDSTRMNNDLESWIEFFLIGIIESAKKSILTFEKIIDLRKDYEKRILVLGSKVENAQKLLLYLYSKPIVNNNEVSQYLGLSYNPGRLLVSDLENLGILEEITNYSRNKKYVLREYIELFK
jgi:Fic family protein